METNIVFKLFNLHFCQSTKNTQNGSMSSCTHFEAHVGALSKDSLPLYDMKHHVLPPTDCLQHTFSRWPISHSPRPLLLSYSSSVADRSACPRSSPSAPSLSEPHELTQMRYARTAPQWSLNCFMWILVTQWMHVNAFSDLQGLGDVLLP